jgi:hypothetical protein
MKGIQILVHSIRQVLGNLGPALRVSLVPNLIQFAAMLALGMSLMTSGDDLAARILDGSFSWLGFTAIVIVSLVCGVWIAVAWHRYVLLVEEPGFVPTFRGDRILAYFGNSVLIVLILIIPAMIAMFIVGLIARPLMLGGVSPYVVTPIAVIVFLPIAVVGLRLGAALPGIALGAGTNLSAAWEATKGDAVTFGVLTVVWWLGTTLISWLILTVFGTVPLALMLVQFLYTWAITMIGVSILTTLYGHCIERRALV